MNESEPIIEKSMNLDDEIHQTHKGQSDEIILISGKGNLY